MQNTLYAHEGDSPEPSSLPDGGAVTADPSKDLSCTPDFGVSQHLPRELCWFSASQDFSRLEACQPLAPAHRLPADFNACVKEG